MSWLALAALAWRARSGGLWLNLIASSVLTRLDWLDLGASSALARPGWLDLAASGTLARHGRLDLTISNTVASLADSIGLP